MRLVDDRILLSPGDLTKYLACEHLTSLSLAVARGEIDEPEPGAQAQMLFEKGIAHEQDYLEQLRAEGLGIREIPYDEDDLEGAARATEAALREGVDVVYQAVLLADGWRGIADFLLRQPDGSYEALDTKLAWSVKPAHVLQLCFYSEQLARLQGKAPERFHVLLGTGVTESHRLREFDAYARRVRRRLERFVTAPPHTEPFPNDHCGICEFKPRCDAWWDEVDHLSRVAGLYRTQIERLKAGGIATLAGLAAAEEGPPDLNPETFAKLRSQARLQLARRETGALGYELLEPAAGTGLALLPDPSAGDLFFDIEGYPFRNDRTWPGSLEYLWGALDANGAFEALWASGWGEEQAAFETFVDRVHERLAADPALHVYHYGGYEVTALRRLRDRYRTRDAEVDDLLGRGVFVDLYKVVRGGIQASVPGYGLKELEAFLDLRRESEIKDGLAAIAEYEEYAGWAPPLPRIEAYNREDCVATMLLRDWLLERRAEALARFGPFPEQEPKEPPAIETERTRLQKALQEAGEPGAASLLDYDDLDRQQVAWAFFDPGEHVPGPDDVLERIGRSLLAGDGRYPAVASLLDGRAEMSSHDVRTDDPEEIAGLVLGLDGRRLAIQTPPGSAKSAVCARLIERLRAEGKRVGIAAAGETAIDELLSEVEVGGVARETGTPDSGRPVDCLLVLDAGQVRLVDAVAMGARARNLVLLGDRERLVRVLPGARPGDVSPSALQSGPGGGVLLDTTFRLHPDICAYISEEFYEGRLRPAPSTARRTTPLGTGLRFLPAEDDGAEVVAGQVARVLAAGVPAAEILVVAAHDAQVSALRELVPDDVAVGTVVELRRREADVVLYSLASSTGEDVPRDLEPIIARNRLNAAISRARCLAYLVASPRLLDVNCRTLPQMRLANALSRFVEMAES